jgi:hypothetical protein
MGLLASFYSILTNKTDKQYSFGYHHLVYQTVQRMLGKRKISFFSFFYLNKNLYTAVLRLAPYKDAIQSSKQQSVCIYTDLKKKKETLSIIKDESNFFYTMIMRVDCFLLTKEGR